MATTMVMVDTDAMHATVVIATTAMAMATMVTVATVTRMTLRLSNNSV